MYRILVTGSRTWTDSEEVTYQLDWVLREAQNAGHDDIVMVNGRAEDGADWLCFKWAKRLTRIPVEEHPADWKGRGRAAGILRNTEMVKSGADICVAFLMPCLSHKCRSKVPHWTHGTDHCVQAAERANIPVLKVFG